MKKTNNNDTPRTNSISESVVITTYYFLGQTLEFVPVFSVEIR